MPVTTIEKPAMPPPGKRGPICQCGTCATCRLRIYMRAKRAGVRRRSCECGECKTCKQRQRMRLYRAKQK